MTKWWNLVDTRHSECRALEAWEFDSPLRHFVAGAAGAQLGFISPTCPVRYRDLQPCGWASAQWSFIRSAGRVRPPDPPLAALDDRARKQAKRRGREPRDCGFDAHLGHWQLIAWSNGKGAWVTTRKLMVRFHP